jgi:predicted NAD-dependent protein-ADP-ribosyltransferase YbiA (DUF1768 family)
MPNCIDSFKGKYAFLSDSYLASSRYESDFYGCEAAAFAAARIINVADRISFMAGNCSPWQVQKRLKTIPRKWIRPDWSSIQVDVLRKIMCERFTCSPAREWLLDTGDALLINGNLHHDNFLGTCFCQTAPTSTLKYGAHALCKGVSQNIRGKMLMQLRDELRIAAHLCPEISTAA